jgi:hypothetical protein
MIIDGLQDGTLCSDSGELDEEHFEVAMRHQLRQYAGRRISDFLYHGRAGDAERAQVKPPIPIFSPIQNESNAYKLKISFNHILTCSLFPVKCLPFLVTHRFLLLCPSLSLASE